MIVQLLQTASGLEVLFYEMQEAREIGLFSDSGNSTFNEIMEHNRAQWSIIGA